MLYALKERRQALLHTLLWSFVYAVLLSIGLLLVVVGVDAAYGAEVADQPDTPIIVGLSLTQVYVAVGMTALGYFLNYLLPFLKTDAQKGVATLVYQGIGVVIVELATSSDFGLNQQTLVAFLTAMVTWLAAHKVLWAFDWAPKLGAGRNVGDPPAS